MRGQSLSDEIENKDGPEELYPTTLLSVRDASWSQVSVGLVMFHRSPGQRVAGLAVAAPDEGVLGEKALEGLPGTGDGEDGGRVVSAYDDLCKCQGIGSVTSEKRANSVRMVLGGTIRCVTSVGKGRQRRHRHRYGRRHSRQAGVGSVTACLFVGWSLGVQGSARLQSRGFRTQAASLPGPKLAS